MGVAMQLLKVAATMVGPPHDEHHMRPPVCSGTPSDHTPASGMAGHSPTRKVYTNEVCVIMFNNYVFF